MSIINSQPLIGASGQGGYFLTKSLRFRSSASAYLNRTPASATNRQIWTWSGWVKRGALSSGSYMDLFTALSGANDFTEVRYHFNTNDDTLVFTDIVSGNTYAVYSTNVYRDASAWYHIVCSVDTTQATNTNRVKLYVNGVQVTQNAGGSGYPLQNTNTSVNATVEHRHGGIATYGRYFDGYMAEINFIDGQTLTPSSFGQTSPATGVWQPIKYTGTYGTNGFYLPFTDTTSTTTISEDFSGNNNDWTSNNISLTAGSTYDSMTDVPTLTNATTANYWTLNPLNPGQLGTPQSGNLEWIAGDQNNFRTIAAPILPSSGKFYWEVQPIGGGSGGAFVSGIYIGIMNYANGGTGLFASGARLADTGKDDFVYYSDGRKVNLNSFVSYGTAYVANDIIGVAVDIDNGKIWFSLNGTWQASGDPAAGTNAAYTTVPFSTKTYAPAMSAAEITNAQKFNFGQRPFAYTPPTGFVALNTFNLPTPTIGATASSQANKYFDATLFTGTGANATITNSGSMQPDFVWGKSRSNAFNHILMDSVRGTGVTLFSNSTSADYAVTDAVTSFNSNGFSYGVDPTCNTNGSTNVFWQWRASNATAVTNTAGSITSTVSANTTAGFSIVTYTGNGSSPVTIGHGLGVIPAMIILKDRDAIASWMVKHQNMSSNTNIFLEGTGGEVTPGNGYIQNLTSSTTFGVINGGSGVANVNTNGNKYVAYCFSAVAGYSAFGSYTGNGSSDGPFVFTGFRPRFIMIKRTDTTANWFIFDTARDTYNAAGLELYPNLANAETDGRPDLDILSNGMKMRSTATGQNANGGTYIYACFCESPFKYSLAR